MAKLLHRSEEPGTLAAELERRVATHAQQEVLGLVAQVYAEPKTAV
jgi:hypothetical protein